MKTSERTKKLWKVIDKITLGDITLTFDFTKYACAGDPLKYLFEQWKPYYNIKYHLCRSLHPKSILEIGFRLS